MAKKIDIKQVIAAIDAEPECPGHMPDTMWEQIKDDRRMAERAIQLAIKLTKDRIKLRLKEIIEEA